MTTLNAQMLLEGVTPGPWNARTTRVIEAPYRRVTASGHVMEYGKEIAWTQPVGSDATRAANARLIASAPSLARRVIELEGEGDGYMAALRWVYENGLPHDSKRPDFVNQAFSDAYAPNRAALNGEQTA